MQPKIAVGWRANILLVGREFRFYRTRGEERAPEFFAVIYGGGSSRVCTYAPTSLLLLKTEVGGRAPHLYHSNRL